MLVHQGLPQPVKSPYLAKTRIFLALLQDTRNFGCSLLKRPESSYFIGPFGYFRPQRGSSGITVIKGVNAHRWT